MSPGSVTLLVVLFLALAGGMLSFLGEPVFWPGFWAIAFFYGLIFYIGALAGKRENGDSSESLFLAGRAMPLWMGAFTMSATWVGGGYINGTAESTAASGLAWVQAPWGYALSLVLGGLFLPSPCERDDTRRCSTL